MPMYNLLAHGVLAVSTKRLHTRGDREVFTQLKHDLDKLHQETDSDELTEDSHSLSDDGAVTSTASVAL